MVFSLRDSNPANIRNVATDIVPTFDSNAKKDVESRSSSMLLTAPQKIDEKRVKLFLDCLNSVTKELWQIPSDSGV